MAERIPPLTPRQSRAVESYEAKKRLAEKAWVAILASPSDGPKEQIAEAAWLNAEVMYQESQRRRPVE
jgi:uncharacterized iron-regulated protein